MYKDKVFRTWVQIHTQQLQHAKKFCPPPPPPALPKMWHPGQNRKIQWGVILSPKMMILQGVGHLISPSGVYYANDPKIGRYGARACA